MASEIGECIGVHKRGPARQARVAEREEHERLHLRGSERLLVLLLQRRFFDVAGGRQRGEHPFRRGVCLSQVELRKPLIVWNISSKSTGIIRRSIMFHYRLHRRETAAPCGR